MSYLKTWGWMAVGSALFALVNGSGVESFAASVYFGGLSLGGHWFLYGRADA